MRALGELTENQISEIAGLIDAHASLNTRWYEMSKHTPVIRLVIYGRPAERVADLLELPKYLREREQVNTVTIYRHDLLPLLKILLPFLNTQRERAETFLRLMESANLPKPRSENDMLLLNSLVRELRVR